MVSVNSKVSPAKTPSEEKLLEYTTRSSAFNLHLRYQTVRIRHKITTAINIQNHNEVRIIERKLAIDKTISDILFTFCEKNQCLR